MKKSILAISLLFALTSCGWHKIGTLTMASTRNVDSKTNYVLIQRYVTAKVKNKNDEVLQNAIDKAVKETPGGEYMMNVKLYVKKNGKKVKIEGDVWGLPGATTETVTPTK